MVPAYQLPTFLPVFSACLPDCMSYFLSVFPACLPVFFACQPTYCLPIYSYYLLAFLYFLPDVLNSYLPAYLPTSLPTYLPLFPTCLPTFLPAYLPTCIYFLSAYLWIRPVVSVLVVYRPDERSKAGTLLWRRVLSVRHLK